MIIALGEILIDYTQKGFSHGGMMLFEQNAGGATANVLACVSKFGEETAFIGKVGDDMQGEFLRKTLKDININDENLITDKDFFTTLAFVSISETGERSFSFARKHSADTNISKEEINLDLLKKADVFHFGSLSLTHKVSKEATFFAIENAKKSSNTIISYDPNYRASLWESENQAKNSMREVLKYVDVLKISEEECELLTDEKDIYLSSKILIDLGIKIVVVTLGEKGALLVTSEKSQIVNGFKANCVKDTTGAGDSFWGAFLYSIQKKNINKISFDELLMFTKFANATASICVEDFGAIKSMPSLEKVLERLQS